jgi:Tol biopolymer transport system component
MNISAIQTLFSLALCSVFFASSSQVSLVDIYIDPAPTKTPAIFAPGIVSSKDFNEMGCTFSPDGREFYFARENDDSMEILMCRYSDGQLSSPASVLSSGKFNSEPHLSLDNKTLYVTRSNREDKTFESGIWTMIRSENGWSLPTFFRKGMYVSTTNSGAIYYSGMLPNGWISGQIVRARPRANGFSEPIELAGDVNSDSYELHPCVSPQEDFIIFVSRRAAGKKTTREFNDLYLSFRNEDGSWGKAIYLGDLLGESTKMCPSLSPDQRFLFYSSNGDIYWVSTDFVEHHRPRQ